MVAKCRAMKSILTTILSVSIIAGSIPAAVAQAGTAVATTNIGACRRAAVESSPLLIQQRIATEKWDMKSRAVGSTLLPQLEVNAQGSYQSAVPKLLEVLPMGEAFNLSHDQYRATLDLNQVIYGGGTVRNTRRMNDASAEVETTEVAVSLDRLRDRINNIYLEILFAEQNIAVNALMQATLESDIKTITAQQKYGTATGSAMATLEARRLELAQQRVEIESTRGKLIVSLSTLTGLNLTPQTQFTVPVVESLPVTAEASHRTEIELFESRRQQIEAQNRVITSKSNPKLSLFASGGYGRPGYNFLSNNFDPMGIAGLRLNVPLTQWDATSKEKKANILQSNIIDQQQVDFQRNNKVEIDQALGDIRKWYDVSMLDPQIVAAREHVRRRAAAQFKDGVITQTEYVTEFNNEAVARLDAEINRLRVVQAWITYQAALGKY